MNKKILTLFLTFLRIGAFTFGGGYAMIPLIQREMVETHGWVSDDDILEIIAIAESTPGPIAINSATFIGYKVAGVWGSFFATLGVVLPSFVIISIIAYVLRNIMDIEAVKYAFSGIKAGVLALVLKAWWTMYKKCKKSTLAYFLMLFAFVAVAFLGVNTLVVIISSGVIGLLYSLLVKEKMGGNEK